MALKPKPPAFEENNSGTAVAEAESPPVTETQASASPEPDAQATGLAGTMIAKAQSSAVAIADAATRAKAFQKEVEAMKGASDFSYGNYDVFKGSNGVIIQSGGDEADLGRWAKVRLMSWDEHFEVSPGAQSKTSKDFVAYSKDGLTIDSVIGEDQRSFVGSPVNEYVTYLRDKEGFDGAKSRRFVDTACALLASDSGDGPIGTVVQITLSETSIPAFKKYQQALNDTARCVSMGLAGFSLPDDPFTFFFLRELASKGDNKWTKLKMVASLPAKV